MPPRAGILGQSQTCTPWLSKIHTSPSKTTNKADQGLLQTVEESGMPCCASATDAPGAEGASSHRKHRQGQTCVLGSAHHSLPEMTSEGEPAHTSQNHTKMAHPTKKPPQMAGLGCLDRRHDSLQNAQEFFPPLPRPKKHFKSTKRKIKYFFDPKQLFCIKTHFTPSTLHCPV